MVILIYIILDHIILHHIMIYDDHVPAMVKHPGPPVTSTPYVHRGRRRLVELLEVLGRGIRQELCRGHQGEGRVDGHRALAAGLHVVVVGHLDAIPGGEVPWEFPGNGNFGRKIGKFQHVPTKMAKYDEMNRKSMNMY